MIDIMSITLPEPNSTAKTYSTQLQALITQTIEAAGGALSFADYMRMALYQPGLGYYSAGNHKIGQGGDFITAPEISPLFSHCLATTCRSVLTQTSGDILELGPGTGKMAADILDTLAKTDNLPTHYYLLEVSAELRQRQATTLAQYGSRIQWLETLPTAFSGIILANEVLDALPVHCFERTTQGVQERQVCATPNGFQWHLGDANPPALMAALPDFIAQLPIGYQSEVNIQQSALVASLSDCLTQGVLLFIDYGFLEETFYHPSRSQGTLMCHYRHLAHDNPFFYPGAQDITAHVNFSALGERALSMGLEAGGYATQAQYLLNTGLADIAQAQWAQHPEQTPLISQHIQRLTAPHEMGELFKVMAFTRDFEQVLPGFD